MAKFNIILLSLFSSVYAVGQNIPSSRPSGAMSGSEFINETISMNGPEREKFIINQITSGNIPNHLRRLIPVTFTETKKGKTVRVKIWVQSDYMAIGSSKDFVRIPMNLPSAQKLAQQFSLQLPTAKIVDIVHKASKQKLKPQPLPPTRKMHSNGYYKKHHDMIENQKLANDYDQFLLLAGHKKDVILSKKLIKKPHSIAIYGWHYQNGRPIQPISTVHKAEYADYSHGIRFVSPTVEIDGVEHQIEDVLSNPQTAWILSNEGVIKTEKANANRS